MDDPYRLLGIDRRAGAATIKAAYRRMAKDLHPDRNPGDASAERRFKAVTAAYRLLSDPVTRRRYDRGQIDLDGNPIHRRRPRSGFGGFAGFNVEDLFGDLFRGGRFGGGGASPGDSRAGAENVGSTARRRRGEDRHERLSVPFAAAVLGGRERLATSGGRVLEITVPPGAQSGQRLRLKGQGHVGSAGGAAGDLLVELDVQPHPQLTRKGDDLQIELPIGLALALDGGKAEVSTVDGAVRLNIPSGANSGHVLRLRGKGVARADGTRGDQLVRLVVMLPERIDDDLAGLLRRWAARHPEQARSKLDPV